jgi:hypothetical protein
MFQNQYEFASRVGHSVLPSIFVIPFVTIFLRDSFGMPSQKEYPIYIFGIIMFGFLISSGPLSEMSRRKSLGIGVIGSVLITVLFHAIAAMI